MSLFTDCCLQCDSRRNTVDSLFTKHIGHSVMFVLHYRSVCFSINTSICFVHKRIFQDAGRCYEPYYKMDRFIHAHMLNQ